MYRLIAVCFGYIHGFELNVTCICALVFTTRTFYKTIHVLLVCPKKSLETLKQLGNGEVLQDAVPLNNTAVLIDWTRIRASLSECCVLKIMLF